MGWLGGGVERVCNMMTAWTNRCAIRTPEIEDFWGRCILLLAPSGRSLRKGLTAYKLNSLVSPPAFFAVPEKRRLSERWLLLAE